MLKKAVLFSIFLFFAPSLVAGASLIQEAPTGDLEPHGLTKSAYFSRIVKPKKNALRILVYMFDSEKRFDDHFIIYARQVLGNGFSELIQLKYPLRQSDGAAVFHHGTQVPIWDKLEPNCPAVAKNGDRNVVVRLFSNGVAETTSPNRSQHQFVFSATLTRLSSRRGF